MKRLLRIAISATVLLILSGCDLVGPGTNSSESAEVGPPHPVFRTPVTGVSSRRPAILVEILNDTEILGKAELYLSVQSSRFPTETHVLFPLNVGEFAGLRSRFVQLPFEVTAADVLVFNLLDEDSVSSEDEKKIQNASRIAGYCLWVAGSIYAPDLATLARPHQVADATQMLGEWTVQQLATNQFDNYGTARFIVPPTLPNQPNMANKLTIVDSHGLARVELQIYGPPIALDR